MRNNSSNFILKRVKSVIVEQLDIDKDLVTDEATFKELGADSLDAVEIAMKLEEEFEIEISDEDAKQINSVSEAVTYIERVLESTLK